MIKEILQFIQQHPILIGIWFILLISLITTIINEFFGKINYISNIKAIQMINKKEAIILDLRNPDVFNKGHIINSINLTIKDIQDKNLRDLNKYKHKSIIIISINGLGISSSVKKLMQYGFKNIFILKDGITGWLNENLPLFKK